MGLVAQAMTAETDEELGQLLQMILNCDCSTGYMHESFLVTNSCNFTRTYFGWSSAFFAELIDYLDLEGKLTAELLALPRAQCGFNAHRRRGK